MGIENVLGVILFRHGIFCIRQLLEEKWEAKIIILDGFILVFGVLFLRL